MDDERNGGRNCEGVRVMKNILKFALFLTYLIVIFWIKNWGIFLLLFLFNYGWMKISSISIKSFFKNLRFLLPFVFFTGLLNSILENLETGGLMMIRLLLAYVATYSFSKSMTTVEFAKVIENLMVPLRIFNINHKNIGIMISISLCVIPILKSELEQKRYALKAKGLQLKWNNMLMIIKPLLISILRRTNEMEKSLRARGYEE